MNGTQPTPAALDRACAVIYQQWRRFVSDSEARDQADAFRQRVASAAATAEPDAALDSTLAAVAREMAA